MTPLTPLGSPRSGVDSRNGGTRAGTLVQDPEAGYARAAVSTVETSIIVPTRNEELGIGSLLEGLFETAPPQASYEVVLVDDSDDSTVERAEAYALVGRPVVLAHRAPGSRTGGLSGAVVEGFRRSTGEVLVVMDADFQHPPQLAWQLAAAARVGLADVVVASRYGPGGSSGGLSGLGRVAVSELTRHAARAVLPRVRRVRDPLSGFFALRREVLTGGIEPSGGFKILLDVLALGRWSTAVEVPFTLAPRRTGSSKAGVGEGIAYLRQLRRLARLGAGR